MNSESRSGGLASSLVHEDTPRRMLYVLHGIFGAGRNWASVMRRFVRARPEWGARLIDLRQHGASHGFAPPHTLAAAADDLARLADHHGERPVAVLGHSFGGKVALMYGRAHGEHVEQLWIVDSTPEARVPDGTAWRMLELLRGMPDRFETRDQLVTLLGEHGIPAPTAQWMATNLHQTPAGFRWRFDLDAIELMLRDFFEQDLWDVLEAPPASLQVHLVKARESSVLSPAAIRRITELAEGGRVFLHYVDGGHWVNADNPEALLSLMNQYFSPAS